MKKTKEFKLSTKTDLKIFVLFLLDNIRYPVDKTTVMSIVAENTNEIIIDTQEENFKQNNTYKLLSLLCIALIDLGLIEIQGDK